MVFMFTNALVHDRVCVHCIYIMCLCVCVGVCASTCVYVYTLVSLLVQTKHLCHRAIHTLVANAMCAHANAVAVSMASITQLTADR